MTKKHERLSLDIPVDDIECWEKYPKYRWVYELTRLLDSQGISWSPYETNLHQYRALNIYLQSNSLNPRFPGFIFVQSPEENPVLAEVYVIKGEIKHVRYPELDATIHYPDISGKTELKVNAFTSIHLSKFTGVFVAEIVNDVIYRVRLRPHRDLSNNSEIRKLLSRIYKKSSIISSVSQLSSDPSDRVLRESVAS